MKMWYWDDNKQMNKSPNIIENLTSKNGRSTPWAILEKKE